VCSLPGPQVARGGCVVGREQQLAAPANSSRQNSYTSFNSNDSGYLVPVRNAQWASSAAGVCCSWPHELAKNSAGVPVIRIHSPMIPQQQQQQQQQRAAAAAANMRFNAKFGIMLASSNSSPSLTPHSQALYSTQPP
jgi:hypothetical protein